MPLTRCDELRLISRLGGVLLLVASLTSHSHPLECQATYAGKTHRISVTPRDEAYGAESVSIDDRFHFKAVHVRGGINEPRIAIYVYREDPIQPILIQHVQITPPYPRSERGPVDLFGEQRLYAGKLERELIYRCQLESESP